MILIYDNKLYIKRFQPDIFLRVPNTRSTTSKDLISINIPKMIYFAVNYSNHPNNNQKVDDEKEFHFAS